MRKKKGIELQGVEEGFCEVKWGKKEKEHTGGQSKSDEKSWGKGLLDAF